MSSHVLSSHVLIQNSHWSSQFKDEYLPTISFSAPQSERRVLMSLKCPANRMLSASLVSHSAVRLGSKLSSQVISSSNMAAGLIFSCSISDAARNKKKGTQKKLAALEMQNINTKNFKQFGNGFCPQVNRFHQVTQLTFQKEWATQCQEQTMPGTSTGQSAHWQVTLSPRCSNSSVKAILHLFYRRKTSLEAAIRMTESGVCTYLHVRSSSNWHLRSKYSVHCDKSLKQV